MKKGLILNLAISFLLTSISFAAEKIRPPIAPINYFFPKDFREDYIIFSGMFLPEGSDTYNLSNPFSTRICCSKWTDPLTCTAVTGSIIGEEGSMILDADLEIFMVESWTPLEIVAVSQAICYKNILTMRIADKRVSLTQIPIATSDPLCKKLSSQRTKGLTLRDGREIWVREITKNCKKYYENCK